MARKPFLSLDGFEELLARLDKAGASLDRIADDCARGAAEECRQSLVAEMRRAKVDADIIRAMPAPRIEREGNRWAVQVGFFKDHYDPREPSEAYKAIFLNYGTPHRTEAKGQIKARGFVKKAKRKAAKAVKARQEKALRDMLGEVEG